MTDKEIYEQLKEGANPSYIDGLRDFDTSEVIQWMISYHQEVNADLLEALELILSYHDDGNCVLHREDVSMARAAIKKALGDQND